MSLRSYRSLQEERQRRVRRTKLWLVGFLLVIIFWPRSAKKEVATPPTVVDETFVVFIHPGDGGDELGAIYPNNATNPQIIGKDLNLQIAQAIARALAKEGVRVELSRQSDIFIDALERKERAQSLGADLAIAVYVNSYYDDPLYTGFEIIDYKKVDWPEHYQQRVAFSRELEAALTERLASYDTKSRGVFTRNSAFVIDSPTIVLLPGFISNEAERQRLIDENYQWEIANAVTDAVIIYRDNLRSLTNPPAATKSEEVTDQIYLPF